MINNDSLRLNEPPYHSQIFILMTAHTFFFTQGKLVYANYGREEDFEALEKLGVNCSGKIVIMRYGKIGRATKVCTGQPSPLRGKECQAQTL